MSIIADTPNKIELYRMLVLRKALELEIKGIYMHRGLTAYSTIKKEYLEFFSDVISAAQQKGEINE